MPKKIATLLIYGVTLLFFLPVSPLSASETASPDSHQGDLQPGNGPISMADNFIIMYDPSSTMDIPYKETGLTRIQAQKQIIRKSNQSLPDLGWQTGLYPHWKGGLWLPASPGGFLPLYRLQRYDQKAFAEAVEQLPESAQGPPMLQIGLMKLEHLLGLPGRTEVFLFSDGQDSTFAELEPQPMEQARKLAKRFDICYTIISSAATNDARALLDQIASVNSCSQVIDFDTVFDHPEHLLGKLFLDTGSEQFNTILFDFDRANIKPEYIHPLDKMGRHLQQHPEAYLVLSGFTDNIGTKQYNLKLSKKRAKSVQHYLQTHFQLNEQRLLTYWYGFADPVASNDTKAGRRLNRRVALTLRNNKVD